MRVLWERLDVLVKQRGQRADVVRFGAGFFGWTGGLLIQQMTFAFELHLIGSCHKRASTSCAAITGAVFSLGTDGRSLTSGLNCAMTPARTAVSGNSVAQGKSNFRLSLSAMVVCARSHLRKIRSSFAGQVCCIRRLVLFDAAKRGKRACTKAHQPTRTRRRRSGLTWSNAFTEPSLISLLRTVRQDNSGPLGSEIRLLA